MAIARWSQVQLLVEIDKQFSFRTRKRFGLSIEPKWQLRKRGCFVIISDRVAFGSWNEERWGWGVFLMTNDHQQVKTGLEKYEGLRIFSDEGGYLELI
jgi:hypothetical protein